MNRLRFCLLSTFVCLISHICLCADPKGDPQGAESIDPYLEKTTLQDLQPGMIGWGPVQKVNSQSPAEGAGLEVGDIILAADGYRVYDYCHYGLIRYMVRPYASDLRWVVERRGRLIELHAKGLMLVRRAGFDTHNIPRRSLAQLLKTLKISFDPDLQENLLYFSAAAVDRIETLQAAGKLKDTAWLAGMVQLYTHLTKGEWKEAEAIKVVAPDPLLEAINTFYQRMASLRVVLPEAIPTPKDLEVSPAFFAVYYPYSPQVLPELGHPKWSNKEYIKHLSGMRHETKALKEARMRHAATLQFNGKNNLDNYLAQVQRGLLDPDKHGGWFYRSHILYNSKTRNPLVKELQERLAKNDDNRTLYAFALLGPLAHKNKTAEIVELLSQIREDSPYLAYRATQVVDNAASTLRRPKIAKACSKYLAADPLTGSLEEQRLIDHLAERVPRLIPNKRLTTSVGVLIRNNPYMISRGFAQADPRDLLIQDFRDRVNEEAFANHREALLTEAQQLFRGQMTEKDFSILKKLTRDGRGSGLLLDCSTNLFYWHPLWGGNTTWMHRTCQYYYTQNERRSYPAVKAFLKDLDWTRPEVLTSIQQLFEDQGRLATTLLIADALQAHDQAEAAQRYRGKVFHFFDTIHKVYGVRHTSGLTQWIRWLALAHLSSSPNTAHQALEYGKHYLRNEKPGKEWDSTHLYMAQAYLHLDRALPVVKHLASSIDAKADNQLAFFYDGTIHDLTHEYRHWLIGQAANHEKSGKSAIRRFKKATRLLEVHPDAAADFLGMETEGTSDVEGDLF